MPEFPIMDSIITSINAQEPWPDNVKLFQPYEVEQILLPDNASCLAVQAFLKMCNLPFEVEMRWNAEFMSPSGRVPFIKCGAFVVSELEPIVQFAANKGISLCNKLSTEEKAEMRAYMSLITNVLVNAELYISWVEESTFNAVTRLRNSSVYPWPLGWLQTRAKRNAVAKRLKALHWYDKTLDQVLADVEQCCNSLSQRLGERDFFFGNTPSPLDALVYGHTRALLSASGPKAPMMIKPITSVLLKHLIRMVNATKMKLTAQEDYLVTQACQITHRRLSPERTLSERSTRIKRSKMCLRNASRDSVAYSAKDVFGFRPFASKQIIILTSKDGEITCEYDAKTKLSQQLVHDSRCRFVSELIDEIIDKVDEVAFDFSEKLDFDNEKMDFEIIAFPNIKSGSNYGSIDTKNDYLDTIDEIDVTDAIYLEKEEVHIITNESAVSDHKNVICDHDNDICDDNNGICDQDKDVCDRDNDIGDHNNDLCSHNNYVCEHGNGICKHDNHDCDNVHYCDHDSECERDDDSDGLVNEKLLASEILSDVLKNTYLSSDVDSSNNKELKESYLTLSCSGEKISLNNSPSDSSRTPFSSDSIATLKIPNNEEISVESLLNYLRMRNAAYNNYLQVADID